MQTYSKLLVILPCHSMEDFPTHHRGSEAASLLANWTAIWHPALMAASQSKPDWHQADNQEITWETEKPGVYLAVVPPVSESSLDARLIDQLKSKNAIIISNESSREKIIQLALDASPTVAAMAKQVDPELASDFLALGYAFLQTQIMTRQLRYSSNLDEKQFSRAVVAAAQSAVEGQHQTARSELTRCFDILLEEKNSYYPVEPELIDVVLTASTTLGKSLTRQLSVDHRFSLMLTGATTTKLADEQPENLATLKQSLADQKVTIIGGLEDELPEPLLSTETLVHQIDLGHQTIGQHLNAEPKVFLRRTFGLTPSTPGVLEQFNYAGAVHATLDDGKFPPSSSCNIRWTGDDDRSILAFGDVPLSAADPGSFLGLGVRLGEAIDSAHVASVVLVHWPDGTCEAFDDLVRIAGYSPLLGNFVGFDDYFESIYDPGYGDTFTADEYKTPYLKQAIEQHTPNPVSRVTRYWERFYKLAACRSLLTQACARHHLSSSIAKEFQSKIGQVQSSMESALNRDQPNDVEIDEQLENLSAQLASLDNQTADQDASPEAPPENPDWIQLVNATSLKRRIEIKTDSRSAGTLKQDLPVVFCDSTQTGTDWLIEVPAMGTAEVSLQSPKPEDLFRSDPKVSDGLLLRNEFFELQVDEVTGGIRGIQLHQQRGNLASQQIAVRIPNQKVSKQNRLNRARYTKMVADNIQTHDESKFSGKVISTGRLLDGETEIATFQQSFRVTRGKRVVDVELELSLATELTPSVNHYVCSRLAWKDESARVFANTQETRQQVTSDWFHATNFLEIVQDQNRLTMLTGGLPYHRRTTRRMVDSLLVVPGEQQRKFRFGIGVNVPYAMAAAQDWMTPAVVATTVPTGDGKNQSGWLFHFDCKNILSTWWQPFFDEESRWAGVQIRLRETEGRKGTLGIHCPRKIASGERVNFAGDFVRSLDVAKTDSSKLEIEFDRFEFFQISIHWKQ